MSAGIEVESDPLKTPTQFVRGVGPVRAGLLAKLNLHTVEDLLLNLPRDVLDLTQVVSVFDLKPDTVQTVCGVVVDIDGRESRKGMPIVAALLQAEGGFVRGVWFNQPYMLKKFEVGQRVLFSGKPKLNARRWEFSSPRVQWLGDDDGADDVSGGVIPRYRLTDGLTLNDMHRLMRNVLADFLPMVVDYLPESFRQRAGVVGSAVAFESVHAPKSLSEYEAGRRRVLFDDLLEFQIALALRRRAWTKHSRAIPLPNSAKVDARIRRLFPFRFTAAQDRAIGEITTDLAKTTAMHRLLQADVGAGKTAVAVYAMLVAIAAGTQTVLMAPTEVLAQQHWQTIESLLSESRVNRRLLTGQLTLTQRKETLSAIAEGSVQLIVGTQAVIQDGVKFHSLGLAVIDEQHKFGVRQRARFSVLKDTVEQHAETADSSLATGCNPVSATDSDRLSESNYKEIASGQNAPHVLVMTATPIPRSLCLTQFGDLDLTLMNELPPGRQKIVTSRVFGRTAERRAWDFVKKRLAEGRQAYVVCPRVEQDESKGDGADGFASAEAVYRTLSAHELASFRVGMVHGQLARDERNATMQAFRNGDIQVLVATTVIEVGVDVPNATLMIIHQSERFGLSQLHQLRGRIGRGRFQGYCFLFSESETPDATRRLAAMESTSDGFQIAEVDFELRGPGDVLGTRQSGTLPLRVADLVRDRELLEEARVAAFNLVQSSEFDQPEFAPMKIRVLERFAELMNIPQTG